MYTCEQCESNPATHIVHGGGSDPTDWHMCDTCDPDWRFHRNRSKLVEEPTDYPRFGEPGYPSCAVAVSWDHIDYGPVRP